MKAVYAEPLVHVSVTPHEDGVHNKITYFVGTTEILNIDILKDVVPSSADKMLLTQILVTPHTHLAVMADVHALISAGETSGPRWDNAFAHMTALLGGPQLATEDSIDQK